MTRDERLRRALGPAAALAIVVVLVGTFLHRTLDRVGAQPAPEGGDAGWVTYGALDPGSPRALPYWIWYVMPRVFADLMPGPGGYAAFGVPWDFGHEVPVGFAQVAAGYPRIANNCALCHTATYRTKPDETPHFVLGGPGHTANVQQLYRFYGRCADDSKFDAGLMLEQLALITDLSFADRLLYRAVVVPRARRTLHELAATAAGGGGTPDWGPGRASSAPAPAGAAAADVPAIWALEARAGAGKRLGWGGEWDSPLQAVTDSAAGLGAAGGDLGASARRLVDFFGRLPPPKYPFADKVDRTLVERGRAVYAGQCAGCHAAGGERTGTVIPLAELGTDGERLRGGSSRGYVAPSLAGIWLRAPYLHNGSVPTLRALLDPEDRRPAQFFRGYDVLDPENVGFLVSWPDESREGFAFDTRLPGNGKAGHRYGTDLAAADKDALLEYLKTE